MATGGGNAAAVGQFYEAFGRGDVEAIVAMMAPRFNWSFIGGRAAPYSGTRTTIEELRGFIGAVAQYDDIQAFEPREVLDAGAHVTVLGFERTRARPDGKVWESEWVHVFTFDANGRLARFWGMLDTEAAMAARRP